MSYCSKCDGDTQKRKVVYVPDSRQESIMRRAQEDCRRLKAINAELLAACEIALARIESDIESGRYRIREGDVLRAAISKAESPEEVDR
jgi:hypothetical protein